MQPATSCSSVHSLNWNNPAQAGIQPDILGVTRIHNSHWKRRNIDSHSLSLIKIRIAKGRCLHVLKFSWMVYGWYCIATGLNKRKFSYLPWLSKNSMSFLLYREKRKIAHIPHSICTTVRERSSWCYASPSSVRKVNSVYWTFNRP